MIEEILMFLWEAVEGQAAQVGNVVVCCLAVLPVWVMILILLFQSGKRVRSKKERRETTSPWRGRARTPRKTKERQCGSIVTNIPEGI